MTFQEELLDLTNKAIAERAGYKEAAWSSIYETLKEYAVNGAARGDTYSFTRGTADLRGLIPEGEVRVVSGCRLFRNSDGFYLDWSQDYSTLVP